MNFLLGLYGEYLDNLSIDEDLKDAIFQLDEEYNEDNDD